MAKTRKSNRRLLKLLAKNAARTRQRIPQEVEHDTLHIAAELMNATVRGLRDRSDRWRESGAVWIGVLDGSKAKADEVIFFHELCDDHGQALSLQISEAAKFALYEVLAQRGKKLVGMIHTHPEDWVDLSWIDRENQLCSRVGFWSLVLPHYAKDDWNPATAGVHIRLGSGWYQFAQREVERRVILQ